MVQSGVYNYIDILNKAADASWARDGVINNNLANATTPGYKRQDVNFENLLERELRTRGSVDYRVGRVGLSKINYNTYTDMANYSYRLDGNNVDEAMEQGELASTQIKYNAMITSIMSEFSRLKSALV